MTEDERERMEFLRQSIESHDRQLGELAERMDNAWAYMKEVHQEVRELNQSVRELVQTTQLNFDRLTKAMTGLTDHVVDHQHRLEALERNQDPGTIR
jgi:chromosome segregation ATPase